MDMTRDEFLAALISELEKQRNDNAEAFEKPKAFLPVEVYRKLCFDFPIVSSTDVEGLWTQLADQFGKSSKKLKYDKERTEESHFAFNIDPKFMENITHIAGSVHNNEDKALIEQTSILCAIVFIKLMKYMLLCDRVELSKLLDDRSFVRVDATASPTLPWMELVERYSKLMKQCTTPLFHSVPFDVIKKCDILVDLVDIIGILNSFDISVRRRVASTTTEIQLLNDDDAGSLEELFARSYTVIKNGDNERELVLASSVDHALKELWAQRVFFARDMLVLHPSLIEDQLPGLINQLLSGVYALDRSSGQWIYQLDPTSFPVANECLVVIVFSTISQNLLSRAEFTSSNRTTSIKIALRWLKQYMEPFLDVCCRICERMCLYGGSVDEGVSLALDICSFLFASRMYCSDAEARNIDVELNRLAEKLVSCRLWPWLMQVFMTHVAADADTNRQTMSPAVLKRMYEAIAMASAESEVAYGFINISTVQAYLSGMTTARITSKSSWTSGWALLVSANLSIRTSTPTATTMVNSSLTISSGDNVRHGSSHSSKAVYTGKKKPSTSTATLAVSVSTTPSLSTSIPASTTPCAANISWSRELLLKQLEIIKSEIKTSSEHMAQLLSKSDADKPSEKDTPSELSSPKESDITDAASEACSSPATTSMSASASAAVNDAESDHQLAPRVPAELLYALASLAGLDNGSLTRMPHAKPGLSRLLHAHPDLRVVLSDWCSQLLALSSSLFEMRQGSKATATAAAALDKSWHDFRKLLKIWKAECDTTASKIE